MNLPVLVMFFACATAASAAEPPIPTMPAQQVAYAFIAFRPDISDYYPAAALALGEQGTAELVLCYDQRGKPVDVTVVKGSGYTRIDEAAVRWGRAVQIKPALIAGVARPGCVWERAEFSLEKSQEPVDQGEGGLLPSIPPPAIIWPQLSPGA